MNACRVLLPLLLAVLAPGASRAGGGEYGQPARFTVVELSGGEATAGHRVVTLAGRERLGDRLLHREYMHSRDQHDYPLGESACGPVALLNILVWYQKFGLLEGGRRFNDAGRHFEEMFREIDGELSAVRGLTREEVPGTTASEIAGLMDRVVRKHSAGGLRVHARIVDAPLAMADLQWTMANFRSAILLVRPREPESGELLGYHAVTVLRAGRDTTVSVGTWGTVYRGRLREREGAQWLLTGEAGHYELKVMGLLQLLPFAPLPEPEPAAATAVAEG